MNKSLSDFIKELEAQKPESVLRITQEVSPEFEVPAILQKLEDRKMTPVVIFENVKNLKGEKSKYPLIVNLFGHRERIAMAMDSTMDKVSLEYAKREKPVEPKIVSKEEAQVKQVIMTGEDVDLYELPVVT